jgi:hypothetical protein
MVIYSIYYLSSYIAIVFNIFHLVIAFSDNGTSMIIGSVNAAYTHHRSAVSLYTFSNGMYLNSSIDIGECGNAYLLHLAVGKSVAISGDGVYTFVSYRITDTGEGFFVLIFPTLIFL